eukprot:COSAG05_NODE_3715_length_1886_cov_104.954673_1_plen_269_part_10
MGLAPLSTRWTRESDRIGRNLQPSMVLWVGSPRWFRLVNSIGLSTQPYTSLPAERFAARSHFSTLGVFTCRITSQCRRELLPITVCANYALMRTTPCGLVMPVVLIRYWAIALPAYVCVTVVLIFLTYSGLNMMSNPPLDSLSTLTGNGPLGVCFSRDLISTQWQISTRSKNQRTGKTKRRACHQFSTSQWPRSTSFCTIEPLLIELCIPCRCHPTLRPIKDSTTIRQAQDQRRIPCVLVRNTLTTHTTSFRHAFQDGAPTKNNKNDYY